MENSIKPKRTIADVLNKKILVSAITFLLIGVLLGSFISYSTTPSSTLYLSGGIYPGAPDFTLWKESDTYYAKNIYGRIVNYSSYFSEVFQYCNDNGGEGYSLYLATGTYIVDHQITLDRRFCIWGSGTGADETFMYGDTILRLDNSFPDTNMFYLDNSSGLMDAHWQIPRISNMVIFGNMANNAGSGHNAIYQNGLIIDLQVKDIWFDSWYGHAIVLQKGGQHRIDTVWFEHQETSHTYEWIKVYGQPYFSVVQNCIIEGNAFKNYHASEYASHWAWFGNQFLDWSGTDNTCIDARMTECFSFVNNHFKVADIAFLCDDTSRSLMIADNIFGGAGGTVNTVISGTTSATYLAKIDNNRGFENEAWGSATLVGAATTLLVNTGFTFADLTYTTDVYLTPRGSNYGATWHVVITNSTHFTITRATGGANIIFEWYARTMPPTS